MPNKLRQATPLRIILALCNVLFISVWLLVLAAIIFSAAHINEINKGIGQQPGA